MLVKGYAHNKRHQSGREREKERPRQLGSPQDPERDNANASGEGDHISRLQESYGVHKATLNR
jgi:hypothetical protein